MFHFHEASQIRKGVVTKPFTLKSSIVTSFILAAFLFPAAPLLAQHQAHVVVAQEPSQLKVAETDDVLRNLWVGHVFWVRNVVVETLAKNNAARDVAEKEVVANAKAIAAAIEPYYGKASSEKLFGLLAGHYSAVKHYLEATAAGSKSKQNAAVKELNDNAGDIASFLSGADPNLPFDTLRELLIAHGARHIQQIQQIKIMQYEQEAQTWAAIKNHMYVIADAPGEAIDKQFTAKFS
ncbi:MAG: hypothetical protein ACREA9_08670 [Pyrinomonadaceae bacterium]